MNAFLTFPSPFHLLARFVFQTVVFIVTKLDIEGLY